MMRIIAVVTAARETIRMSRSYSNPDIAYSFPSTAVPPPRSTKRRASTLAIRDVDTPSGSSNLAVRSSIDVPLVTAVRVCRSCGNPAHILDECPVLYYSDTNNNHGCNWSDSFVGKAWLAQGEVMWQERLILPGYETRKRYHPADAPPYLMCNSKKPKGNQGGGKGSKPNQGNQNQGFGNRGNQNQGNQNQGYGNQNYQNRNQGNPGPGGNQGGVEGTRSKNPRGGKYNPPQGDKNASTGSADQQGIYDDVDSSDITVIKHSVSCVIASVIPAILPDEFLHDPSTLPSDHLNVLVQDKDKENQTSVRRTVGKAVLDTANYSEDFASFTMIDNLNATSNCYAAPTAITVCSGLDGQCYINNEMIDLSLNIPMTASVIPFL